jgi:hypothetical protein
MKARSKTALGLACAVLAIGLAAAPAGAQAAGVHTRLDSFSTTPLSTQAGGHGDLLVTFGFDVRNRPPLPCDCNFPREVTVNTPPGMVGFPTHIPRCTGAEFATQTCPSDSQIGVTYVNASLVAATEAVFNMVPRPDQAALLAFEIPFNHIPPIYTSFTVRTESDFGLEAKSFGILHSDLAPLAKVKVLFWGVPGDRAHDALRFPFGGYSEDVVGGAAKSYQYSCEGQDTTAQLVEGINPLRLPDGICANSFGVGGNPPPTPYNAAVEPFLVNPTSCSGPGTSALDVLAYDFGSDHADAPFPGMRGCDLLSFNPSLAAKPTTTQADSASGLDVDLRVPQPFSPNSPSPSQIRATEMVLPEGFAVNSAAADGKEACTAAQARFGTREQAQCPEHAKIGTLAIHSSALPGALPGALYLGEPLPGNRYRVILVADGFSLHIKLAGRAVPDPVTGQLRVIFEDLPQAPFEEFTLHVFGGEGGLLATPTQCGSYPVKTTFTPWDAALPEQTSTQFFTIDSGPGGGPCPSDPRPFDPTFSAGVTDSTAGQHTDLALNLTRPDGDQNLTGLSVKLPPGLLATLKGVSYCPQAALDQLALGAAYSGLSEQASSACPANSQVGTVVAGAGAGSKPFYAPGKAYLAGPYKDAPLSLEVVIPAVSGPYDLGNVAVRNALYIDPNTSQASAVADPLPQIVEGIPTRTRSVLVNLDRTDSQDHPNFTINPTNCDPFSIDATLNGDQGASAQRSSHFQVANCADLGFGPKLSFGLKGGTKRNGHPAFTTVLSTRGGDANIHSVQVTLPAGMQLDQSHINAPCTRPQFAAHQCPAASVIGTATATSPLVDYSLTGPVYLRTGTNPLPDLVLDLHGPPAQPVEVIAVGKVDTVNARLRTTFETVPDAPFAATVSLQGQNKGLLVNNTDLCKQANRAKLHLVGQNGRSADSNPKLAVAGCANARKKHKRHHQRHKRHPAVHRARRAGK